MYVCGVGVSPFYTGAISWIAPFISAPEFGLNSNAICIQSRLGTPAKWSRVFREMLTGSS